MKRVSIKYLVAILFLLELVSLFLTHKSFSNKDINKIKEIYKVDEKMFAMYIENSDTGDYDEYLDSTTFPEGYIINKDMTTCVDNKGNAVDNNILSYDDGKVTTTSNKTVYCYLYFSIPKWCNEDETAAECLLKNPTTSLNNTNMEGGMYRYQGTTADNYVCFGTSSQSDCLANTDKYLYRIIGIDANNQLKLIKNSSIGKYSWHSSNSDVSWPDSDLFKSLNGLETDTITPVFVDSSTYDYMATGSIWNNKIVTTSWKYGNATSNDFYGDTMYAIENPFGNSTSTDAWTDEVNSKISLMYLHDYYYAYGIGGNPGNDWTAAEGWIFSSIEWTMTRMGIYNATYYVWVMGSNGIAQLMYEVTSSKQVRPVFFLNSNTKLIRGSGLSTDPFIIN